MTYRGLLLQPKEGTDLDAVEIELSKVTFIRQSGGKNFFHVDRYEEDGEFFWRLQISGPLFDEISKIGSLHFGAVGKTDMFHIYDCDDGHVFGADVKTVATARSDIPFFTLEVDKARRWRVIASEPFFGDIDNLREIQIVRKDSK